MILCHEHHKWIFGVGLHGTDEVLKVADLFSVYCHNASVDHIIVSVVDVVGKRFDDDDNLLTFPRKLSIHKISEQIVRGVFRPVIAPGQKVV